MKSEIFPATTGGAKQMCIDMNVPFLGSLPLDPKLARCCDEGRDYITFLPDSPAVIELNEITLSKYHSVLLHLVLFFNLFSRDNSCL